MKDSQRDAAQTPAPTRLSTSLGTGGGSHACERKPYARAPCVRQRRAAGGARLRPRIRLSRPAGRGACCHAVSDRTASPAADCFAGGCADRINVRANIARELALI